MTKLLPLVILITACSSMQPTEAESKHMMAGFVVGTAVYGTTESPGWACAASTTAGLAKELYDATGRGHPTARDVVWTALPTCALWYSIDWWRQRR